MKIVAVKSMVMGTAWRNLTFVQVITDEGLVGVGEVRMLNHTDALRGYFAEAVPNHILGHDPFDIESLVQGMYRNDYARPGEIAMSAIATIEIACWDIKGQALGQPVYKLLGGAVRPKIKAYANGWYTVERTPQEFHDAATRAIAKGYRALKLDPFGAGFYVLSMPCSFNLLNGSGSMPGIVERGWPRVGASASESAVVEGTVVTDEGCEEIDVAALALVSPALCRVAVPDGAGWLATFFIGSVG